MFKNFRSVLLAGMVAVGVAACGDDVTVTNPPPPPPPPPGTVRSISVAPDGTTLAVGATRTFTAAVVADDGIATTVTWTSSDPAVATVNAASGVVTGVSAGSVAIKATSTVNPTVSGQATLTVSSSTATVSGVDVTPPSLSLDVGQTAQLAATVLGTNNPSQTVTWSSLSPAIASVNATTGLVTALTNGTAVIRATSTANTNFSGTAAVTVSTPAPAIVSLQSLTVGATNVPVNLNNVFGQIEATINLDAGAQAVTRVEVEFSNLLQDGSVFNQQILAAQTLSVSPAPSEADVSAAPQTIVLSFNTNQVRMGANTFVPVTYNGNTRVRAVLVLANGSRIGSNDFVIVMNNPDAALVPGSLETDAGATSFGGWWKSGLTTNITYLSYSRYTPTTALVTISGGCGAATNSQNGGNHLTGIIITRRWTCAGTEATRSVTGLDSTTVAYPVGSVGFDGSVVVGAKQLSTRGGVFQVVGQDRWNVITPLPVGFVLPSLKVDNLGPTFALGVVAYDSTYDQQWVNASYAFGPRFALTDSSGVATGTFAVYEFIGSACSAAPAVTTGADFPETLTSDLADSKRICARAVDNLGNASTSGASNNFGVDKVAPSMRLYFATGIDQAGTAITPGVSTVPNTTMYQVASAMANQAWGLEAQDTRAGFNQFVVVGVDAATQSLIRLSPTSNNASACTLSDQLTTTLSDNWKRTMLPFTTLDCGAGVGYYFYSGTVNDRAGNFPAAPIVRNFVYDPGAPNITGLGFDAAGYTSGAAATFSVAANDDLSVMTGTLTFLIPGMKAPWVGIQYPHGSLNNLGTPWATLQSQLTHILNGGALTVPNFITRIDESCQFNADPYASCDVTTNGTGSKPTVASDYNANLFGGGVLTSAGKVPQTVITNVADIVGREAVASLVTPILLTQYNGHTGGTFNNAPWGPAGSGADIATWTGAVITGPVIIGEHKTISSNGLTYFDDASLWRLNGATNVWVFCNMMTTPTVPFIDNGSFRIWRYTSSVPAVTTPCGVLAGGAWKVMGRKGGAGLFTVAF